MRVNKEKTTHKIKIEREWEFIYTKQKQRVFVFSLFSRKKGGAYKTQYLWKQTN